MKQILIFLTLILPAIGSGKQKQSTIDSMATLLATPARDSNRVKLLTKLAFEYSRVDPAKGLDYSVQAIDLAREIEWDKGVAEAYGSAGISYSALADYEKALEYELLSLKLYKEQKDLKGEAAMLANISLIHMNRGDYPEALDFGLKALRKSEDLGDKANTAVILENIGSIYFRQKEYDKTLRYYELASEANQQLNNRAAIARNKVNLGRVFNELGEYEKSLRLQKDALKINEDLGLTSSIQINLVNLGNTEHSLGNFRNALGYQGRALRMAEKLNDRRSIGYISGNIGMIYLSMAKAELKENSAIENIHKESLSTAISYLETAIAICKEVELHEALIEYYEGLSEAYALAGRFEEALYSFQRYTSIEDSIHTLENKKRIAGLETNHEIAIRDKNLRLKDAQLRVQELEINQNRNQITVYILGIALLTILIFFIIRKLRAYQQSNKELLKRNKEQVKLIEQQMVSLKKHSKVLNEITYMQAHDVRGPLSTLLGLIQLFNFKDPSDPVNEYIINNVDDVTKKLDTAVKEVIYKNEEMSR